MISKWNNRSIKKGHQEEEEEKCHNKCHQANSTKVAFFWHFLWHNKFGMETQIENQWEVFSVMVVEGRIGKGMWGEGRVPT